MLVLMVAEKPMLAEAISKILSNGSAIKRKGWNGACNVHEYFGAFGGERCKFKMTSTCGHVMGLDFPPKFNNWDRVDPLQLYAAPVEKKESTPKLKMRDFLSSEAKGADVLVLWLDCDKEGENICFEVIDAVRGVMRPGSGQLMENVYRAHFSAITDRDIKAAMNNLGRPNENESLSVDARQELDLRVGCSFTRFQTTYFQGKYGDLDSTLISFGPCQTPTLGFCVSRHDEIQCFKSEPFWSVALAVTTQAGSTLKLVWARARLFDRDVVQLYHDRVKACDKASVVEQTVKEGSKQRPQALNTVELMRIASSGLSIGPQQTMSIAEHLYTQGYISYPRTETTSYPANFDLQGTLQMQRNNPKWGAIVGEILSQGITKPRPGEDKGDHPPITPMRADDGRLSGDHSRVYDYIAQHFIATLMGNCRYWIKTIKFEIGGESFSATGHTLIDAGFTAVLTWHALEDQESLPELKAGDLAAVSSVALTEGATSPPDYLTESELISLMEKHGIGTDASIPVHINNITQRNYVALATGRRLEPTKLGIALVHGYLRVDAELIKPTMRAAVETQLNLIAQGKADFQQVKDHALENFRQKFIYFVNNISSIDLLFEVSFTTLKESGKPFSRCGQCRRFMKLVETRPQRLHCANCEETYSVPSSGDGVLRTFGEKRCPLDDFELVYWQGAGGKLSRSFPLCPYCYNRPPFPTMRKGQGCNECAHPACSQAVASLGVVRCPQQPCPGGDGVLVLDAGAAPKWRLACNKCPAVVPFCEGAVRARVAEKTCDRCGARLLRVEYKAEKSPLENGETNYTGCLFCDEQLTALANFHHANRTVAFSGGGGRGRGRGRGRGGRGARRGGGSRGRGRP